jgi:energy-converting hydrogenase Eha subunit H
MTGVAQTAATSTTNQGVGLGGLLKAGVLGGALAAVVNLALFFGAKAAGVAMTGEFQPGQPVTELMLPAVIISSVLPGLVAAFVAFGFKRLFAANAARNFGIVAAVLCVLSFGGPANVQQISTGTIVVMELMHVVAALGIAGSLVRALKDR